MATPTPRFRSETLTFLKKAGRQKRTDWLDRHRDEYEQLILEPLKHLAQSLKTALAASAPGYHFPQQGIGRIKRAAHRAEAYGAPFKNFITYSASRPSGSRFDHNPNLYFMIDSEDDEGDEVLVAGGLYMPSSRQLRSIREAIAHDAKPFENLFESKAFAARFPGGFSKDRSSTRPPRGFDPHHPKLEWLKLQGYFVWRSYRKKEYTSTKFPELVVRDFAQILRLNELLDQAISGRMALASKTEPAAVKGLSKRIAEVEAPRRVMDF